MFWKVLQAIANIEFLECESNLSRQAGKDNVLPTKWDNHAVDGKDKVTGAEIYTKMFDNGSIKRDIV